MMEEPAESSHLPRQRVEPTPAPHFDPGISHSTEADLQDAQFSLQKNLQTAVATLSEDPPVAQIEENDEENSRNSERETLLNASDVLSSHSSVQQAHIPGIHDLLSRFPERESENEADSLTDHSVTTSSSQTAASSALNVTKLPPYYASIRMAPIAFFYGLAVGIFGPVFTELLKARVCEMELKLAHSTCLKLSDSDNRGENDRVIALTAHYSFLISLVGNLPCVIFAIFTGSWSDHFGRKLPMMIPFCGMFFSSCLLIALTYVPTHPAILLLVPLLAAIFGGWIISAAAIYSYIGDYSSPKNLAIDIAVFDGIFALAANIGSLVGGVMYGLYGFTYPFILYGGLVLLTILYVLLFIRDRRVLARQFQRQGCRMLCSTKSVRENKEMLCKERTGQTRWHIFLLLTCTTIAATCSSGNGSINQLFFETPPLNWTLKNYTVFSCVAGIITSLIMILTIPVLKKGLGLKDTAIGIIGVTSTIFYYIALSATEQPWLAVASATMGALSGLQYVAARCLLSNLIDEGERGKMMSVIASLQALVPILGSFLFTEIFSASVSWWPGFSFALAALVMLSVLCGFCFIDVARRHTQYCENIESRYAKQI